MGLPRGPCADVCFMHLAVNLQTSGGAHRQLSSFRGQGLGVEAMPPGCCAGEGGAEAAGEGDGARCEGDAQAHVRNPPHF